MYVIIRILAMLAAVTDRCQEFEYRYRKDHKMLDTKDDLPPSLRKPDESAPKGPIGRTVRKLTPRKASFANLLRGKGWSRTDDPKPADMRRHVRQLQEIMDQSDVLDTADSDDFDPSSRLQAC